VDARVRAEIDAGERLGGEGGDGLRERAGWRGDRQDGAVVVRVGARVQDARAGGLGGGPDGGEGRGVAPLGEVGNGEEVRGGRTSSRVQDFGAR
jgi:hypothetical protein